VLNNNFENRTTTVLKHRLY